MVAKVKAKKSAVRKKSVKKVGAPKTGIQKVSASKVEKTVAKTLKNKAFARPKQRTGRTTTTRISAKNQITIPVEILRRAGFKVGDTINCTLNETGEIELSRPVNPMLQFAGIATGLYNGFDLRADRDSWDE
jgi:bifunctional DNA-binding transcriptional regulator/antitoxin component of YhaV-PrlF toxin-antitoxin module